MKDASPEIHSLSRAQTELLLDRLNGWRSGICPDGKLAKIACFVLGQMPNIVVHPDHQHLFTSEIITEYEWMENLLHCGAITNLDDGIMMKTLANFYTIFHEKADRTNGSNTVNLIQLRKHASFKVDLIFRPTRTLQQELDELLKKREFLEQWNHLIKIWNTFGYLWPRRIFIGYRRHIKQSYSFRDDVEGMHAYYHHSSIAKGKLQSAPDIPPFDLDQLLNECTIVSRSDLAPLHEFLDPKTRQIIKNVINKMFVRIPVYESIKIYNVSTHSYLCWDPKKRPQPDKIFKGETLDYIVRSVSADSADLKQSPESQYLWRFTWYPGAESTEPLQRYSKYVCGGDRVYIYPACKTRSPSSASQPTDTTHHWPIHDKIEAPDYVDTHKMVLSCCPHRYETEPPSLSKLKGLRLLSSQSPYYANEKIDWTLEHPNSRLKYMTEAAMNLKLNIHEYLRRIRPILTDSTVHLQQIGLLTAFAPDATSPPSTSSPPHEYAEDPSVQSLRTTKKIMLPLKSKSTKNIVLCVDEDITTRRFAQNSLWRIEIPTPSDKQRHTSNYIDWPQFNNDQRFGYPMNYHTLLSQGKKKRGCKKDQYLM